MYVKRDFDGRTRKIKSERSLAVLKGGGRHHDVVNAVRIMFLTSVLMNNTP